MLDPLPTLANFRAPLFLPDGMNGFLFETQWLYWAAGGFLALVLWYVGTNRRQRRLKVAGAAVAGLMVVWIAAALLVDTPRERLYHAHQRLAAAATKGDVDGILFHFASDFTCPQLNIGTPEQAHEHIAQLLEKYGVKEISIADYEPDIFGTHARVCATITAQAAEGTARTTWQLTWEDVPRDDWKLTRAELISVDGQDVRGMLGE